ncbi:MAG: efflux RND transporter permease subunit [Gammaproteobacteria bacterium]|nr:efflux RND transporter permease subunit [Gammaproteobacteria bacterium]
MNGFLAKLLANHPFANVTFAVVLLVGFLSYLALPRERDPEINFNWVNIATVMPGASAEDIERRVTKPLEDAIRTVADIKFIISNSREDVSSILVRFRDIPPTTFDKRVNDLRREVQNKASAELPEEVDDPTILEITTSNGFPTAIVLITGAANDETLRYIARGIKEDIERIPGVDSLFAAGMHDPELQIDFDPQQLQARGLTAIDVANAVNGWFRDTSAGKAQVGTQDWLVRLIGTDSDPEYLANLFISPASDPQAKIPLDSVAKVARGREDPAQLISYAGRFAVMLSVNKKSYTNTLELVAQLDAYIQEKNALLAPQGIKLVLADDQTVPTRVAIEVMERNAVIGLALVILVSWVFLGSRIALLIGIGIPFSLAGTFWVLNMTGFTLNISVLLGVVIALGMLVDDAVVVVEAIYYRMQRGAQGLNAAVDALHEVFAPVTSSVLTTLAAFLPLMLLPGIVGKFMFVIPFVVSLALLISLLEAYWMLPTHVVSLRMDFGKPSRFQARRTRFTHWVRLKYSKLLLYVMRRPKRFLGFALLSFVLAMGAVASGAVRLQFFAFDPIRMFYVNVDMPSGSALTTTLQQLQRVEARVQQHLLPGEARAVTANAGLKFTDTEPLYGDHYGQIMVALMPREPGMRDVPDIVESMRADVMATPGPARISFLQISGGPPLAKPVSVKVRGDDYDELRAAADAVKALIEAVPGARDVTDDDQPGRQELVLKLDPEAVKNAGLNAATVARLLRLHVDGEIVASMRDRGEKLDVRVRAAPENLQDIGELLDDPIALPNGGVTTLAALTQHVTATGKSVIKHYNLRRSITVEADLDKDINDTLAANEEIIANWSKINERYPNVDLDFSGEFDDVQESLDAMLGLFVLGVGLIYLILAAQFHSYWQPMLILATVPLAFTGVTLGLLVSRNPLSLYTLYGVIALAGIAVNSAIVLIDTANGRRQSGMSVLHATVYAARRRVVPILITSMTTIAGLFSLATGIGGKSLIWGPVASSIVWGLGFATTLTLFVVPLLYRQFNR